VSRICTACAHPHRAEIDAALAANRGSIRGIARQHRLSPDALERHAKSHLPQTLALAVRVVEETRADNLVDLLHEALADARRLRAAAEKQGDIRCAVAASRSLFDVFERLDRVAEKLAQVEAAKPPAPEPTLTDDELAAAVKTIFDRAAARKEASHDRHSN